MVNEVRPLIRSAGRNRQAALGATLAHDLTLLDSAEQQYTPGPTDGQREIADGSGRLAHYTCGSAGGFILHHVNAVPVQRGTEEAPVVRVEILNAADAVVETWRGAALYQRVWSQWPTGYKIATNLDIAARLPWTFNIEELS